MLNKIFTVFTMLTITACSSNSGDNNNSSSDINNDEINSVSAPDSIAGKTLKHTIQSGSGIFAASGEYTAKISSTQPIYNIVGDSINVSDSSGTYVYSVNSNQGALVVVDSILSSVICLYNFSSASTSFSGLWRFLDENGEANLKVLATGNPASGVISFDATSLTTDGGIISGDVNFSGIPWVARNFTITPNEKGSFDATFDWDWNNNTTAVNIVWSITDNGDGTASIVTLDGNGDGIPGIPIDNGLFAQTKANMAFDGTLTFVSGTYLCTAASDPDASQSGNFEAK
ncbi:MAG TPA: hypothetical protein ENJ28_08320 [Gammaproteobacteria bacterium]|nr:hypothetical protein [Gammaproteobacteria bacterium]